MLGNAGDGEALSLVGVGIVMASSLSYAIYIVGINKSSLDSLPTLTVTFWVLVFGVFLFVGRLLAGPVELTLPRRRWWQSGATVGLCGGIGYFPYCSVVSVHHRLDTIYRFHSHSNPWSA